MTADKKSFKGVMTNLKTKEKRQSKKQQSQDKYLMAGP